MKAIAKRYRERNGENIACENCGAMVTRYKLLQHKVLFKCNCKQVDPKDFNLKKVRQPNNEFHHLEAKTFMSQRL